MSQFIAREVCTDEDLRRFIRFPMELYRGNPYYVPPLIADEKATLAPGSPGRDGTDSRLFLACENGRVVGRIAAIINHSANETLHTKNVRFGWFDCIHNRAAAEVLFRAAEDFGRSRGMKTISGPCGFTSLDKVGLLVEGYDSVPTIATLYNYPYYEDLVVGCGFEKEMDSIEHLIRNLRQVPPRLIRFAELLRKRSPYHIMEIPSIKEVLHLKDAVIDLVETVFSELYDAFPMTPAQRAFFADRFLPYLNPKLIKIVQNGKGEMIAFFIAMPNLSRAFQKARGRLLPFGFIHLWRATRRGNRLLDLCVGGVKKEYRRLGVDILMGVDLFKTAVNMGFEMAETNPELESNAAVQKEWRDLDCVRNRRRRVYVKSL